MGDKTLQSAAVLALAGLYGLCSPAMALDVYYSDKDAVRIQRVSTEAPNDIQTLLQAVDGLIDPRGTAVDLANGTIYFADSGTQRIHRVNLDGTGLENLITTNLSEPSDLELDLASGHMYWADRGRNEIVRANLDGSGRTTIRGGITQPYYINLELAGGKIYWSDFDSGVIHRANIDGSGGVENVVTGLDRVRDIVVEPQSGYIYFNDRDTHKIQRRLLAGGAIEDLFTAADGLDRPHGLALDVDAGLMYWTDTQTHVVARGRLDGLGAPEILASTDLVGPWSLALAVPEPGVLGLALSGIGAIALRRRR